MIPPEDDERSPDFSLPRRFRALRHALRGLRFLIATEHNAWIHFSSTAVVLALGFTVGVSRTEWCWLVVALALVWMAEAFNTALENLGDEITEEHNDRIGRAKDLGAAAVLVAAVASVAIGLSVFGPHFRRILGGW